MLGVGGSQADNCPTTGIHNVNADDHRVFEVLGHVDLVEILADFGVDLFKDVRVDSDLRPVDRGAQNELRSDVLFIKIRFDCLFVFRVADDYHHKPVVWEGYLRLFTMFHIS